MKCKGCGASYDPQLLACPYCGLENEKRQKQLARERQKQEQFEKKKNQVLEESASDIRLQKVKRLMWIMAGLAGFSFMLLMLLSIFQGKVDEWLNQPDMAYLEELREEGRYEAMQRYLYDTYAEREEYNTYWQMAMFAEDGEDLRYYRSDYLSFDKEQYRAAFMGSSQLKDYEREYCISHYSMVVERMLTDCVDILYLRREYTGDSWQAEMYGPMTAECDALLAEYELEARVTLEMILGLAPEEIEDILSDDYLDSAKADHYVERIREGWLYE